MSEKLISRRGAFSLLGLAAAAGFAVPTTILTTPDAEAEQPSIAPAPGATAPSATAPSATAPSATAPSGMTRREARRNAREMRREARRDAREMRREARRGMYMRAKTPTKQQ
jgi:hypothetical protein